MTQVKLKADPVQYLGPELAKLVRIEWRPGDGHQSDTQKSRVLHRRVLDVIGYTEDNLHRAKLEIELRAADSGVVSLSICGEVDNSYGQVADELEALLREDSHDDQLPFLVPRGKLHDILAVWRRWHLNDMRAGCEHQRANAWTSCPGMHRPDENWFITNCNGEQEYEATYRYRREFDTNTLRIMAETLRRCGYGVYDPSPKSLMKDKTVRCTVDKVGVVCGTCGYKWGSKWLVEVIPQDVLAMVLSW